MSLEEQGCLSSLRGRRCWVVGCGFLGGRLLRLARAAGMQALGIDICAQGDVQGDALMPQVQEAARTRLEPELMFCCAATHGGDATAYRTAYLELPRALHAVCPSARLLFCSSTSVYAGQGGAWVSEESPCRNTTPKGLLLQEAEAAVAAMGGVVARLAPLYGEERCELLRRFLACEPELPGAEERWFNYVHVADAARALLCLAGRALTGEGPGVVNVCGESFTKGAVYEALCTHLALPRVSARKDSASRRFASDQRVSAELLLSLGWEPQVTFLPWALAQDEPAPEPW